MSSVFRGVDHNVDMNKIISTEFPCIETIFVERVIQNTIQETNDDDDDHHLIS